MDDASVVKEYGVVIGVILGNLVAFASLYFNYKNSQRQTVVEAKQVETAENVSTLQKAVTTRDEMS